MVARADLVTDPQVRYDLLLARRGTAFFSRKLGELTDDDLAQPSGVDGWSRAHVVAQVGYRARALALLVEAVRGGEGLPTYPSPDARDEEICFGATLPPAALRNLHAHAAVHLNVEWRDLEPELWGTPVQLDAGPEVPLSRTPWLRARAVWLGAIDLGNGASTDDLPAGVR